MFAKIFSYPLTIKEIYLDTFGHVNNATYLMLLEDARWELMNQNGYGLDKIIETGLGPTILEIKVRYMRELRLREEVVIESQVLSYQKKIGKMMQKVLRGNQVCCTAELTIALFDLKHRKLVLPTVEWLNAIGVET